MPYFVYIAGTTVDVLQAPQAPTITPHVFDTADAAHAYQRQLQAHYGLPVSTMPATASTRTTRTTRRVKCCQTGTIYKSAADAARAFGVTRSAMTIHLNHPARYPFVKDHTFERID